MDIVKELQGILDKIGGNITSAHLRIRGVRSPVHLATRQKDIRKGYDITSVEELSDLVARHEANRARSKVLAAKRQDKTDVLIQIIEKLNSKLPEKIRDITTGKYIERYLERRPTIKEIWPILARKEEIIVVMRSEANMFRSGTSMKAYHGWIRGCHNWMKPETFFERVTALDGVAKILAEPEDQAPVQVTHNELECPTCKRQLRSKSGFTLHRKKCL